MDGSVGQTDWGKTTTTTPALAAVTEEKLQLLVEELEALCKRRKLNANVGKVRCFSCPATSYCEP